MIKVPELESFDFDFKNTYVAIYSMLGFHTLYSTLTECRDYVSSATLIRMIADSLAAYMTIYHEPDDEEMKVKSLFPFLSVSAYIYRCRATYTVHASAIARKLALHSASAIFGLRPHIL